jgi:hypothetical protein
MNSVRPTARTLFPAFQRGARGAVSLLIASLLPIPFALPSLADVYTVEVLVDGSDAGTLRWAIEQANQNPGADTIEFDVEDVGNNDLANFDFDSNMPDITGELIIDGGSSAGDYYVRLLPPDGQDVSVQADLTLVDAVFGSGQSVSIEDAAATLTFRSDYFGIETDRVMGGNGSLAAANTEIDSERLDVVFAGVMNLPTTTVLASGILRGGTNGLQNEIILEDDSTLIFELPLNVSDGIANIDDDGIFGGNIRDQDGGAGTGKVIKA